MRFHANMVRLFKITYFLSRTQRRDTTPLYNSVSILLLMSTHLSTDDIPVIMRNGSHQEGQYYMIICKKNFL